MKFLSLFTKIPTHRSFEYRPLYYDPQKERAIERESRIRSELKARDTATAETYRTRIQGSFGAARRRGRGKAAASSPALIRLGIVLALVGLLIAYLTWGRIALYGLALLIPFYVFMRLKRQG